MWSTSHFFSCVWWMLISRFRFPPNDFLLEVSLIVYSFKTIPYTAHIWSVTCGLLKTIRFLHSVVFPPFFFISFTDFQCQAKMLGKKKTVKLYSHEQVSPEGRTICLTQTYKYQYQYSQTDVWVYVYIWVCLDPYLRTPNGNHKLWRLTPF